MGILREETIKRFDYDPMTEPMDRMAWKRKVVYQCDNCQTISFRRWDRYKKQCVACRGRPLNTDFTTKKIVLHGQEVNVRVYPRGATNAHIVTTIWGNWEGELPDA